MDLRAFNAYRHGLTGHVLVIPPAEQAAYQKHCQGIHQSLAPQTPFEADLVQTIADDRWRIQRAAAIEANIFALGMNYLGNADTGHTESDDALGMALTWLQRGKEIERLTLYEGRLQRKVERNLELLRTLQKERRAALEELVEEAVNLPEDYDFPAESLPAKFDFSSAQIHRLARHRRALRRAA